MENEEINRWIEEVSRLRTESGVLQSMLIVLLKKHGGTYRFRKQELEQAKKAQFGYERDEEDGYLVRLYRFQAGEEE